MYVTMYYAIVEYDNDNDIKNDVTMTIMMILYYVIIEYDNVNDNDCIIFESITVII